MDTLDIFSASFKNNEWIIQLLILVILIITLVYYHVQTKIHRKQTEIQNNLYKAQILRDRFDLYNSTKGLITTKHIDDFKKFNQDYIDEYTKYYSENEDNIHTYLYFGKIYEYLLYVYKLKEKYKLDDPIGDAWEKKWLKEYSDEQAFKDLRKFNKEFYPDFEEYLEEQINNLPENGSI